MHLLQIVLKNPTFVDDWKVVVEVEDNTSENSEALDLHLIDLETMIVTPIPGKMFKHLYSIVKVSHEKGRMFYILTAITLYILKKNILALPNTIMACL